MSFWRRLKRPFTEAWAKREKGTPGSPVPEQETGEVRQAGLGRGLASETSREPVSDPGEKCLQIFRGRPFCLRCGSWDIDSGFSNSHDRCRDCGAHTRFEPAHSDNLPDIDARPLTVVHAGFVGGAVGIIERDLGGELKAQRPATRKDFPSPQPVGGGWHR